MKIYKSILHPASENPENPENYFVYAFDRWFVAYWTGEVWASGTEIVKDVRFWTEEFPHPTEEAWEETPVESINSVSLNYTEIMKKTIDRLEEEIKNLKREFK